MANCLLEAEGKFAEFSGGTGLPRKAARADGENTRKDASDKTHATEFEQRTGGRGVFGGVTIRVSRREERKKRKEKKKEEKEEGVW